MIPSARGLALSSSEMPGPVSGFPDPVLTANLYAAGRLDEVIREVVGPFWRELRRRTGGSEGYLWFLRYNRGGEHLKIRLHGEEAHISLARDLLARFAERYFAGLDDTPERAGRAAAAPAVDLEDEVEGGHPDRSLVWTRYRRSRVSLAGSPWIEDDAYAALATRCLGRGADLALAALEGEEDPSERQLGLLQALIEALAALGLSAAERASYFAFHRDSLLRYSLDRRLAGAAGAQDLVAGFERRIERLGEVRDSLREIAEEEWSGAAEDKDADEVAWDRSLAGLAAHVAGFRGLPEYRLDPFAADPLFPLVFKVLHGFANQLGVNLLDEAFAHHLLLDIATPAGAARPRVRLLDLGEEEPEAPRAAEAPAKAGVGSGLPWTHFVARSGPEGERWLEEYRQDDRRRLAGLTERALQQLRRQQIREGKELLDQVESGLARLDELPPSVLLVMQRFFWSTLAYYHYCVEDLEAAEQALEQAHRCVVSALEIAPFLMPLALHAHEFRLQRARVARHRRRWQEMRERLQEVRAMLEGRIPLLHLSDGRPIRFADLAEHYRAIPALDAEEIDSLRIFFDREHCREKLDAFFLNLYVLPGVVIPYP